MAYTNVIIFSGLASALSAFLVWGFGHNLGLVFAFVITFGAIVSRMTVSTVYAANVHHVLMPLTSMQSGGFSSVTPSASSDIVGTTHLGSGESPLMLMRSSTSSNL